MQSMDPQRQHSCSSSTMCLGVEVVNWPVLLQVAAGCREHLRTPRTFCTVPHFLPRIHLHRRYTQKERESPTSARIPIN
eukprot:1667582-Amphidinium_carterae.3